MNKLQNKLNVTVFDRVRAATGVKNLSLFDELLETKKAVDYNKL